YRPIRAHTFVCLIVKELREVPAASAAMPSLWVRILWNGAPESTTFHYLLIVRSRNSQLTQERLFFARKTAKKQSFSKPQAAEALLCR
ncbi:MAG: hypothetical protein P1U78_13655, partial [Alcanivoracaceae bacterium]|nr:hypothetical protein [Alcanivoracaceae bacterium]